MFVGAVVVTLSYRQNLVRGHRLDSNNSVCGVVMVSAPYCMGFFNTWGVFPPIERIIYIPSMHLLTLTIDPLCAHRVRQTFYGHTNAVNHVCCSLRGDMVRKRQNWRLIVPFEVLTYSCYGGTHYSSIVLSTKHRV